MIVIWLNIKNVNENFFKFDINCRIKILIKYCKILKKIFNIILLLFWFMLFYFDFRLIRFVFLIRFLIR